MSSRNQAELLVARANELAEAGEVSEALQLYHQASAMDPSWAAPFFNIGLLSKNRGLWEESFRSNQQATAIDPTHQGAWWNLGIAATAMRRWPEARAAWQGFGLDVPDGDGPIEAPCGFVPVRLDPDGRGEVVWADRLDPARALLLSIPMAESGFRWRDIVLNDGAPVGFRQYQGRDVPVFNVLSLLEPSPFGTYVAEVAFPEPLLHLPRLRECAANQGCWVEDWTTEVRMICRECSEGDPDAQPTLQAQAKSPQDSVSSLQEKSHLIAIAALSRQQASQILWAWESDSPEIRVEGLDDALEPGAETYQDPAQRPIRKSAD